MDTRLMADISASLHYLMTTSPSAGEGVEHASQHIDWLLVGSLFTNFILLFGFLAWKIAPMVSEGLKNRRAQMAQDLEEAQAKRSEAEAKLGEYQEKLDNLEREVEKVIASFENEANKDRVRFEEETKQAIARIEREADLTITQETRKAEAAIRAAAVEATIHLVEDKMKQKIDTADHERLTNQYIERLGSSS